MDENVLPRSLAGNFELTIVLTDKRQLRMTGYVYSDDDAASIDARLDQFQNALDRQAIRADVVLKEAEITQLDTNLEALVQHNDALMNLQKGAAKLTATQKQQLAQFEQSVRWHTQQKESKAAAIAAARRKLNGVYPK